MAFDKDTQIYLKLRARLRNFEYAPGSRIDIGEIADGLNASQTPIRENLIRLAAEDYLDSVRGAGFFAKQPSKTYYSGNARLLFFLILGALTALTTTLDEEELCNLTTKARSLMENVSNLPITCLQKVKIVVDGVVKTLEFKNQLILRTIDEMFERSQFVVPEDIQFQDEFAMFEVIGRIVDSVARRDLNELSMLLNQLAQQSEISIENGIQKTVMRLHYKFSHDLS